MKPWPKHRTFWVATVSSMYLTHIVQNLPIVGAWYFPNYFEATEPFNVLHSDLQGVGLNGPY
jgi:hypothetical protein